MNVHKNARSTPLGREAIIRRVMGGQTPKAAAQAAGVCPRTVCKWMARFEAEGAAGLAELYGTRWRAEPELFDPDIGVQIERGLTMPAAVLAGAMETSLLVRRAVAGFFNGVDILLCATTPCVAWPHDRLGPERIGGKAVDQRGHAVFTPLFNHAWTPAISIPCGRGRDGLPVGLQIVGRVGSDRAVLAFAEFAESVLAETGHWSIA
jgi:Asp-tRNA(Asn)/Glu-tRNA(Gln) amidotransferase A subunit family amidase